MKRAFKTEINPKDKQEEKIKKTIGVCRYVYNLYLETSFKYHKDNNKHLSGYDFSKWLNNVHTKEKDKWIKEVSSKAVKKSIMNGDSAFKNFFKGNSNLPRYKKKKESDVKAYFPKNNQTDWIIDRHRIKIPTIGWVRLKEYGYIPTNGIVRSGTVSFKAGKWYVSVLFDIAESTPKQVANTEGLGIDLGIKELAICSNGLVFENINKTSSLLKKEKKLKREQRSLSRKYENKKRRRGESVTKYANIEKNLLRVQKLHVHLSNARTEHVRSVVDTVVKTKPTYITIEDLNVRGMMKNRHLSKAVSKQKFFYFKQWLLAKCLQHDIELRQVSRWYPSSKLCSDCGQVKKVLKLSDRVYNCDCGLEIDRDMNAAINLLQAKEYTILT